MGKGAVVQFTARQRRTLAYCLEQHGEPHFVYEFLSAPESAYYCPANAAPARLAQLVGNFIGDCHALPPWQNGEELGSVSVWIFLLTPSPARA